jgi:16S rRNA (guanine527-N7)-methyltransferase
VTVIHAENELQHLNVSRETLQQLEAFEAEFKRWASRINLVAPSTLEQLRTRHSADSAQILSIMPEAHRIIDLGSGGGFPGLILALLLKDKADSAHVDLVESNTKKCAFLSHMVRTFGLPAQVHNARIEDVLPKLPAAQLITARALAPLTLLLELALPQLQAGALGLFHKGRDHQREIAEARGVFAFDLIVHNSQVEADSVLIEVSKVRRLT